MVGCSVRGRVATPSGAPIGKVEVTLTSMDFENRIEYVARTAADGAFRFDEVEAGQYHLAAYRRGFVRAIYGGHELMNQGTPITIAPDRALGAFEMTLLPQSVIAGRVLDPEGEPLENIRAVLQREIEWCGKRQVMPMGGQAVTNDLGEFRIAGVAPGKYLLSASAEEGMRHSHLRRVRRGPQETLLDVYYPDASDAAEAQWINVPMGATLAGYELRMKRGGAFRVAGMVETPEGVDARSVTVHLRPVMTGRSAFAFGGSHHGGPEFEFDGVLPGRYTLAAQCHPGGQPRHAATQVEVVDRDVRDVVVRFPEGVTISGVVRGGSPLGGIAVNLSGDEAMVPGGQSMTEADGTFTIRDVPPGRYRLGVYRLPKEAYLKSARHGGAEIGDEFEIDGPASLELELGADGGVVSGIVKGAPGAAVQLRRGRMQPHWAFADQDGRFEIRGVAPGEYRVVAGKQPCPDEDAGGVSVTVAAGGRVEVELAVE